MLVFFICLNSATTKKFEVLVRLISRFVMDENSENKRGIVYDSIGWLRVNYN